jgi:tetratricopeptide (TPR) repeat protein
MSQLRVITAAAMAFGWGVVAAPSALAFGALAIDANEGTRHGAAFDQATVEAARARALAECGDGCTVVVAFRRFCAAYAADRTPGSRAWGRSGAPTQAEAERKALDNCRLYDGNACQVRLSACDSDARSDGVANFELEPPVVPDGWSRFEQRVLQDHMPDYTRTRTRRIDYFHPRDLPEGSLTRLLDDFFDFIDLEVMPVASDRRFKVLISRRSQHVDNIRALFGDTSQPGRGRFYSREDVLATYDVGPGTMTSLLMYPVLNAHIPHAPAWARTAIATFFERVYAYPGANERLVFNVGYHNPWRLYEVAGCLDRLDLDQIISNPNYAGGQSHLRLVGTFLWRHGRFKNFIDRLYDRDLKGRENYLAAAFDRPMTEVVALWRDYLAEIPSEPSAIPQMPVSRIYSTQQEFEAAMAETAAKPSWPEWILGRVFQRFNPPGCPIRAQSALINPVKAQSAIANTIAADGEIGRLMQEALAASRADDHRRAAELYTQALAIEPGPNVTSRDLHAARGSEYNYLRMPAQAFADYDAALRIGYSGQMSDEAIRAHMGRGYALVGLAQYRRATDDFDVVLRHVPNEVPRSSSTLTWRGVAYQHIGDRERAIADYKAALALDPENATARDGLKSLQSP